MTKKEKELRSVRRQSISGKPQVPCMQVSLTASWDRSLLLACTLAYPSRHLTWNAKVRKTTKNIKLTWCRFPDTFSADNFFRFGRAAKPWKMCSLILDHQTVLSFNMKLNYTQENKPSTLEEKPKWGTAKRKERANAEDTYVELRAVHVNHRGV